MLFMAMTQEEEKRVDEMEAKINSMFNVIVGDRLDGRPGFADRMKHVEKDVADIRIVQEEHTRLISSVKKSWKYILIAVAIGFILGGLAFGWLTVRDAVESGVKLIK